MRKPFYTQSRCASAFYIFMLYMVSFIASSHSAYADDLHPTLTVVDVQADQPKTRKPNKIYLHIAEHNSTGTARVFTVPELPLHWPKKHIHSVDNMQVWGGAIKENHSTTLIIQVMERDAKPWNTDDLVGVITVNFKNYQGKLMSEWTIPNQNTRPNIAQRFGYVTQHVTLKKDNDTYVLDFVVGDASRSKVIDKNPRSLLRWSARR